MMMPLPLMSRRSVERVAVARAAARTASTRLRFVVGVAMRAQSREMFDHRLFDRSRPNSRNEAANGCSGENPLDRGDGAE